jgi:hypothetical protein
MQDATSSCKIQLAVKPLSRVPQKYHSRENSQASSIQIRTLFTIHADGLRIEEIKQTKEWVNARTSA